MTILGTVPGTIPLAADAETGFIPSLEKAINDAFEPIATAVTSVIFWELPLGDYSFPLIVLWLVVAAAVFTVYFRGVQGNAASSQVMNTEGVARRVADVAWRLAQEGLPE